MVMVDSLVTIDGDKVFTRICGQFTVEVVGSDNGLLVLSEALGSLLDDGEHLGHYLVEGFFKDFEYLFLYLVDLCKDVCTFVDRCVLDGGL